MKLTFSNKNIKNPSTSGTIHAEQLLNTNRRPRTSKKSSKIPHNWVGQKEKENEGIWMGSVFQGGRCEGGKFLALREVSSMAEQEDQTGCRGDLRA